MDNGATLRRFYDLITARDIDGFADLLADDFVEHEVAPGLEPTKAGVKERDDAAAWGGARGSTSIRPRVRQVTGGCRARSRATRI